jgi:hypothetical protein
MKTPDALRGPCTVWIDPQTQAQRTRIELPRDGGQGHHRTPDHPESTERGQWRYQHQNNTYQENRRDTELIHSGETQSGSVTPAEAKALLQLAQLE